MAKKLQRNEGVAAPHKDEGNQTIWALVLGIVGFFLMSMCIPTQIGLVALGLGVTTLVMLILFRRSVEAGLSLVVVAVGALVLTTGLSTLYALSWSVALVEFSAMFSAFCLFLLVVVFGQGAGGRRIMASMVAVATATLSLVSIDLLSTRVLYQLFRGLVPLVSDDYRSMTGIEEGIRMTSLYRLPNIYAGIAGLGVLVCLGLAISAERRGDKLCARVCLFWNALGFVLAFSMGGTATLAVAMLVILFVTHRVRRMELLTLMVETLLVTLAVTFPIFLTSFTAWEHSRPIPLVCALVGAVALCGLDLKVGQPLAERLKDRTKVTEIVIVSILVAVIVYGFAAYHLTGSTTLAEGESLRRAAYPDGGDYALALECDGDLTLTIESQNELDTFNHTSSVIYKGDAAGAEFTVPQDSLVVYFNFSAQEDVTLSKATLVGADEIDLPLGYLLLPGFMANRLQGLWANENAIQRLAFYEDGMTIFAMNPIIGMGSGAFQNLYQEVQQYSYDTAYVHNHYIQLLLETGIVGLVVFLGMLTACAVALIRKRRGGEDVEMTAALLAALTFMTLHGAVEANFSLGTYRAMAFFVFGLMAIYGGDKLPLPQLEGGKINWNKICLGGIIAFLAIWLVVIAINLLG